MLPSKLSQDSWLITGGCGFIGTALVKELLETHAIKKIRVFDNLSVGAREDLALVCQYTELKSTKTSHSDTPVVELMVGDIQDYQKCERACKGMDVVVHLAANTGVGPSVENPRRDMQSNVVGTFNMLEAARQRKIKSFIFASSGAPVGEVAPPIHEEISPKPVSPYGASKLAGEGYCSAYFRTFGLKTVALRFGNVYGPGSLRKESAVAKFIKRALDGKPIEIYGDGTQTRDFVFIDDLMNAIRCAAACEAGGEVFQIATNHETTINELAQLLKKVIEEALPGGTIEIIHKRPRIGDVKRNFSETQKAEKILGWKCHWSLEDGLRKTVSWFLSKGD